MPVYNEEACIKNVVEEWLRELRHVLGAEEFKILIINDGSTDRSREILTELEVTEKELIIIDQINAGHGAALVHAYREATQLNAEFIFQVDADNQSKPRDFEKFWSKRSDSDFLLGWRRARKDAFHRIIISNVLRLLLFLLYGPWIKDANVPFRLMRSSYLKRLLERLPSDVFAPNIFLALMASRNGQEIHSIPISHEIRNSGRTSLVRWRLLKGCWQSAAQLWKFRMNFSNILLQLDEI
jgi:dolichol-phosphate mannosyltransferase